MRIRRSMKARTILILVTIALLIYFYFSQTEKNSAKDVTHKAIEQMYSLSPAPGYTLGEIELQGGSPFPITGRKFTAQKKVRIRLPKSARNLLHMQTSLELRVCPMKRQVKAAQRNTFR